MASASASRPFPANQRGASGIARLNMRRSKHDMPGIANIQRQLYVGRSRYAATADANRPARPTRLDQTVPDARAVALHDVPGWSGQTGRAHDLTPVTTSHLVCRLLL